MQNLYPQIYDYENLYQAYILARKQKRYRGQVLSFGYNLEENLIQLQNELVWKTYKVGPYRQFKVWEPKERLISALPFRDRVVQHAVSRVIEPIFERRMFPDSFACRKRKGSLAAANRLAYFIGKPSATLYLKCDIAKYFHSINIDILKQIIQKSILDLDARWIVDLILDSSANSGVPIGNLLSQLFANVYLHELDFHIKTRLGIRFYLRYMDDFIVLGSSRPALQSALVEIERFLEADLHLCLNAKTKIGRVSDGIDFVGYRIFPQNRLIKKASLCRMRKKYRAWKKGKMKDQAYLASIGSWAGHAKGTASHGFVERMLRDSLKEALNRSSQQQEAAHAR